MPHKQADFNRVGDCGVMVGLNRGKGFCQACGHVIASMPHNAGVAGNLAAKLRKAVGGFYGAA